MNNHFVLPRLKVSCPFQGTWWPGVEVTSCLGSGYFLWCLNTAYLDRFPFGVIQFTAEEELVIWTSRVRTSKGFMIRV
jgi:hypothetical protein